MKAEIGEKENYFSIIRINFILLLIFTGLNDMDYFSTYLSIADGGIEINPIIQFMLDFPLLFFIWKIIILPGIIWKFVYYSESKKYMLNMIFMNLIYLVVVWGNLRVVF